MRTLLPILLIIILYSCQSNQTKELQSGNWLFQLQIDSENPELRIPFNVEVINPKQLIINNADERIEVKDITYKQDSVFIKMPVFGSEF